jgi:hypothetical protein
MYQQNFNKRSYSSKKIYLFLSLELIAVFLFGLLINLAFSPIITLWVVVLLCVKPMVRFIKKLEEIEETKDLFNS